MTKLQSSQRRTYKRLGREIWDQHKNSIRQLFLDQDKTHKEVIAVLNQDHGITIG